jgi:hypothetical protein
MRPQAQARDSSSLLCAHCGSVKAAVSDCYYDKTTLCAQQGASPGLGLGPHISGTYLLAAFALWMLLCMQIRRHIRPHFHSPQGFLAWGLGPHPYGSLTQAQARDSPCCAQHVVCHSSSSAYVDP